MRIHFCGVVTVFLLGLAPCLAQAPQSNEELMEKAREEYSTGKFTDAERDFRKLVSRDPSNLEGEVFLGQALFRQKKYAEAVVPYESALELERKGSKLTSDQHRILVDQLVMAYGITGDLKHSRALLEIAVRDDPKYPLNYYNLACINAEESRKQDVLTNLALAFQYKGNAVRGEQMPDPRADSSFREYLHDPDFIGLMRKLGYE